MSRYSRPRKAARKDANHNEIVAYAEAIGFSILEVHQLPGALDVVWGLYGIDGRAEIKDPSKPPSARKLTENEQREMERWNGRKPIAIWETTDDVDETRRLVMCEVAP